MFIFHYAHHIIKIVILVLMLVPVLGHTQTWDETRKNLIYNASQYRKLIMLKDTTSLKRVEELIKTATELESDKETLDRILLNINYAINSQNFKFKKFKKIADQEYPNSEFIKQFTETDYLTIKDNNALLDLIMKGLYNDYYPYKLSSNPKLYKELEFYNITRTDTIAEIGAGDGSFSKILFLTGHNIPILINEIEFNFIRYIDKCIEQLSKRYRNVKMTSIMGNKKNAKLPHKVNKIIIRSSYHHFSNKEKMLSSLHESLTDDGELFIYEAPLRDTLGYCPLQMLEQDIIQSIELDYFSLEDKLDLGDHIVLRFRKKKSHLNSTK